MEREEEKEPIYREKKKKQRVLSMGSVTALGASIVRLDNGVF